MSLGIGRRSRELDAKAVPRLLAGSALCLALAAANTACAGGVDRDSTAGEPGSPGTEGGRVAGERLEWRGMNYFPGHHTWHRMWENFDLREIATDFDGMSAMGVNLVRLFVFEPAPGSDLATTMDARLERVLGLAGNRDMRVALNLVPPAPYPCAPLSPESRAFIERVVDAHRDDPRVALWELANEPHCKSDASHLPASARRNLRDGLRLVRARAAGTPVTVPLIQGTIDDVADLLDEIDVFDVHLYDVAGDAELVDWFARIRETAGDRPIFLGEFGCVAHAFEADWGMYEERYCDYGLERPPASHEQAQAAYVERVHDLALNAGFKGIAPWIYSKFAVREPGTGAQNTPTLADVHFGLVRLDDTPTSAARTLAALYGHRSIQGFSKFGD